MIPIARRLREDSTDVEQRFWYLLRDRRFFGMKFRRQRAIGSYVVDFCAPTIRLVIELDGGHHSENPSRDEERSQFLRARGYRILRFWNHEISEALDAVLETIRREIASPSP